MPSVPPRLRSLIASRALTLGIVLATGILPLSRPAAAAPDDPPANSVYALEKSRAELAPGPSFASATRDDVTDWHASGSLRVKFRDGAGIRIDDGELVEPWIDLPGLGLAGSTWHRSWAGTVAAQVELWKSSERKSGVRRPDPTSFYRLDLPEGVTVADAIERLAEVAEVEAVWPLATLSSAVAPGGELSPDTAESIVYVESSSGVTPLEKGGTDAAGDVDADDAWRDFGTTGRFAKLVIVTSSSPQAGSPDLPPYTTSGGPYLDGHINIEQKLRVAGAPLDDVGFTGIAPHAQFHLQSVVNMRVDGVTGRILFDMAPTISAAALAAGAGGIVAVPWCWHTTTTGGGYLGCLPVEAEPATWSAIRQATDAGVTVVTGAGGQSQQGFQYQVNLDTTVPPGWGSVGPFQWQNVGGKPHFPHYSGALVVGSIPPGGSIPTTNYGARVDKSTFDYNTSGYFDAPVVYSAYAALVESAYSQIGISIERPLSGNVGTSFHRGMPTDTMKSAVDRLLQAVNMPNPSLRVHIPVPGFGPLFDPSTQNVAVVNGSTVRLPKHTQSTESPIFPFSFFNDGGSELTLTATIEYDSQSNPTEQSPFSFVESLVPASIGARKRAEPQIKFSPTLPGKYRATVSVATNDGGLNGQPFEFHLEIDSEFSPGILFELRDANNHPFPGNTVHFGDVDWAPYLTAGLLPPSRKIFIVNRGASSIDIEIDYPEKESECLNLQQMSERLFHFRRTGSVTSPSCGSSRVYQVGTGATVSLGFEYFPMGPEGVHLIGLSFKARRHGSNDPWGQPVVLSLQGETRQWPSLFAMTGPNGKVQYATRDFLWDAGDVEVHETGSLPAPLLRFWSKVRGTEKQIQTIVSPFVGKGELPVGLKFSKKFFAWYSAAETALELVGDVAETTGNLARSWEVLVDLDQGNPSLSSFNLHYTVRPWKNLPAGSFSLSGRVDNVRLKPNQKSAGSVVDLRPDPKVTGSIIPIGLLHDFGEIPAATSVSETYWINNSSNGEIRVSGFWIEGEGFTGALSREVIPAGESAEVTVTFAGGRPGAYSGYFSFKVEGESTNPYYLCQLAGAVSRPTQPVAEVRADDGSLVVDGGRHGFRPEVRANLPPTTRTFTVTNQGQGILHAYNLRLVGADGFGLPTGQTFNVELATEESATFALLMDRNVVGSNRATVQFDTNGQGGTIAFEVSAEILAADVSGFSIVARDNGETIPLGGELRAPDTGTHTTVVRNFDLVNQGSYAVTVRCITHTGFVSFACEGLPLTISAGATGAFSFRFSPDYPGLHTNSGYLELKWHVSETGQTETRRFDVTYAGLAHSAPGSAAVRLEEADGNVIPHGGTFFVGQGEPYEPLSRRLRVRNVGGTPLEITRQGLSCDDFTPDPWRYSGEIAPGAAWEPLVRLEAAEVGFYRCYLYSDQYHVALTAVVGDGLTLTLEDGPILAAGDVVNFPETTIPADALRRLRISNEGLRTLTVDGISLASNTAFDVPTPPAGALVPGQSATFDVVLSGAAAGAFQDELLVEYSDEGTARERRARVRGWVWPHGAPSPLLEVAPWGQNVWHGDELPLREGADPFGVSWYPVLRNRGELPLTVVSVTASHPDISIGRLPAILESGEEQEIDVYWPPQAPGSHTATLTIVTDDPFSPLELTLRAQFHGRGRIELRRPNGATAPAGTTLQLGQLRRRSGYQDIEGFHVHNLGTVPVWFTYRAFGGALSSGSGYLRSVAPGDSYPIDLEVWAGQPTIQGRLEVTSSQNPDETLEWNLAGTTSDSGSGGTRPILAVTPSREPNRLIRSGDERVVVGTVVLDGGADTAFLDVENLGEQELEFGEVSVTGNWSVSTQLDGTTLDQYDDDSLWLDFTATGPGWYDTQLRIESNAVSSPFQAGIRMVVLGRGPLARLADVAEQFTSRGGTYAYPTVKPSVVASRAFLLHNFGNYPLRLTVPVAVTGNGFLLVQGLPAGTVIEPGESALFRVRFQRPAVGDYSGTLSFATNETPSAFEINLTGKVRSIVTEPQELAEADLRVVRSWDGSEVGLGAMVAWETPTAPGRAASRRFRIDNLGGSDLELSQAIQVTGDCFQLIEEPESTTIPAGDVGYFRVRVLCGTEGPKNGEVTIVSNDPDQPVFTFQVAAEVASERAVISVYRDWDGEPVPQGGAYRFDVEPLTGVWTSRAFRIDNPGFASLDLANPAGLVSGDCFALTVEPAATVAPGESTVFRVRLACGEPGEKTGTVTIESTDPAVPAFIFGLSGHVHAKEAGLELVRAWDEVEIPQGGAFDFPEPVTAPAVTSRRFRIDNPGSADLTLESTVDLVSGACFSLLESPAAVVPAGGSAFFRVRLGCATPGQHSGAVTVASADGSLVRSFTVTGRVEAAESLVEVRQGWDGAAVPRGSTVTLPGSFTLEQDAGGVTLVVANPTAEPLHLLDPGTVVQGACFRLDPTWAPPAVVPAGGAVDLRVQVHCSQPGPQQGTLRLFTSRDGVTAAGSFSASLQATVVEPELRVVRGWHSAVAAAAAYELPETRFFTLPPCRLLDTRAAGQGPAMTGGETRTIQVAGSCGVPADAVAVSFNFVAFGPTSNGYLRVFPGDRPESVTSTLNFFAGTNRAVQAVRRLSVDGSGQLGLFLMPHSIAYTTDVIIDVNGYFSTSDVASGVGAEGPFDYSPLPACRAADTRTAGAPLQSGVPRTFDIKGVCAVPSSAQAALVSLTAVGATTLAGNLNLYPSSMSTPTTVSTLNLPGMAVSTNQAVTNGALVALGPGTGDVELVYNGFDSAATSHAVLDTMGYFASGGSGLAYYPLEVGCRALYTRVTGGSPLGNSPLTLSLRAPCGIPLEATALMATVTPITPNGEGYLKLYPSGSPSPVPPVATFWAGTNALAHGTILPLGPQPTNEVTGQFFNFAATPETHLAIDVFGYFQRPTVTSVGSARIFADEKALADSSEILDGDVVALPVEAMPGDIHTSAPFQIHNDGEGDLHLRNAGIGMVDGACFNIRPDGTASPVVPAGGKTAFRVWWGTHCGPGEYPATVRIESNDADEDPLEFTVVGRVELPASDVVVSRNWNGIDIPTGSEVAFPGTVVVNQPSAPAFLIHNPGAEPLQIANAATAISGQCYSPGLADPVPSEVAAGATALFRVRLECPTAGTKQGTVRLAIRRGAVAYRDHVFTLTATVTPPELPQVTAPEPQTVPHGGTAAFSVTVTSPAAHGPFTYAWQELVAGSDVFASIAGADTATLTLPGVTLAMSGSRYRCLVSNAAGQSNSGPASLSVIDVPRIEQQPASQRVVAGSTATFTVGATGSGVLGYAWRRNGAALAGATDSTLTLVDVTDAVEGAYTVVVTNAEGSTTSAVATLTVVHPPVVSQPQGVTVTVGVTATFSVAVSSPTADGPFVYAWQHQTPGAPAFTTIAGATSPTLSLPGVTTAMSGTKYRCLVSNEAGQSNSGTATLTVSGAPTITVSPQPQRVVLGSTAVFSVGAAGSGLLSYAWSKDGTGIPGATSSSLTLAGVTSAAEGSYTVRVTNSQGAATSSPAALTVVEKPLVGPPASVTVAAGGTATFSATVSSPATDGPFTYAWQRFAPGTPEFTTIAGATSSTLQVTSVTTAMSGSLYRCLVSNEAGQSNSGPATLTVTSAPAIVQQPVAQRVNVGSTTVFTVAAAGSSPISYAWRRNGVVIAGATGSSLTLAAVTDAEEGSYTVVVANPHGSVTSSSATLTVVGLPIVSPPQSVAVAAGSTAVFSVSVNSPAADGPFTYAWQRLAPGAPAFTTIAGASSPTLQVPGVTTAMSGTQYRCLVSNQAGQSNSGPAELTVTRPLTLLQAPASQKVNGGATAVFTVEASGSGTLSYAWRKNGTPIAGATGSSLILAGATNSAEGSYTVVVTDSSSSLTTSPATLTVVYPPVVGQPQDATVAAGGTASFAVSVSSPASDGPFVYAWQHLLPGATEFSGISGASTATLSVPNVTAAANGTKYRCLVTNQAGQSNSGPATLTVPSGPVISQPPTSLRVTGGSNAVFSVVASGSGSLSYAWRKNGAVVPGATGSSLSLSSVTDAAEGSYTVTVANSLGSTTSAAATLTVVYAPVVSVGAATVSAIEGASPILHAVVSSPLADGPFVYQWQELVPGATVFSSIAGAGSPSLTLQGVVPAMDGTKYRCLVSNEAGQSNSGTVTLEVAPRTLRGTLLGDAHTDVLAPSTTFGTQTTLKMRSSATNRQAHAYLRFDLSGLLGRVSSARLRLRCSTAVTLLSVYKIADWDWTEETLTYDNASLAARWSSLGNNCTAGQWIEVDVTAAITESDDRYTFALTHGGDAYRYLYSKETNSRAELIVEQTSW